MAKPRLLSIIKPETGYFVDVCPECSVFPMQHEEQCTCGYRIPLSLVIPYDFDWKYSEELIQQFREYDGLRLMGKFTGKNSEQMSSFSHVKYLYLSRYTGFSFSLLRGFSRLRFLELDYTSISDLNGIESATALSVLELTECRKLADIRAITCVSELRGLRIALCNRIRDYSPLERLTNLQLLTIKAHRLPSLVFLEKLTSLQRVALPVGRLEDSQVPDLANLTALREISVPKKRWSAPFVDSVRSQLPDCEVRVF